jgi:membrane-associated phospholipid phosphatase
MVRQLRPAATRFLIALALFVALGFTSRLPIAERIDRTITVSLQNSSIQNAFPGAARAAADLVSLADAAIMVPGLVASGLLVLFFGDAWRGGGLLLLASGTIGISAIAAFFEHVIVHPGPDLRIQVPRFTAAFVMPDVSNSDAVAAIALIAAAGLLIVLVQNGRGRRPVSLWPTAAAFAICAMAVLFRHAVTGTISALTAVMQGYTPYGFPSGHTARTVLFTGTVLRRIPALGVAVVTALALSLVYLGDHWTSEALGGLCLGWAGAEIAREIWRRLNVRFVGPRTSRI